MTIGAAAPAGVDRTLFGPAQQRSAPSITCRPGFGEASVVDEWRDDRGILDVDAFHKWNENEVELASFIQWDPKPRLDDVIPGLAHYLIGARGEPF